MKRYTIEKEGSFEHPLFYLNIYGKNRPLRFMLDSGCNSNAISPLVLKFFEFFETEIQEEVITAGGLTKSDVYVIKARLSEDDSPIALSMTTLNFEVALALKSRNCVGLLGAQFLQCCRIDFRNLWLEVPEKGGAFSLLKIGGKHLKSLKNK